MRLNLVRQLRQHPLQPMRQTLCRTPRVAKNDHTALPLHNSPNVIQHPLRRVASGRIRILLQRRQHLHPPIPLHSRHHHLTTPPHPHQHLPQQGQRRRRRGQTHPNQSPSHPALQPLQRHPQMRPTLVLRQRMQLIHNHKSTPLQPRSRSCLWQKDRQTLRCRQQNMRRLPPQLCTLSRRRVSRSHPHTNHLLQPHLLQGPHQILLNVISQRPQRRHIHRHRLIRHQPTRLPLPNQKIQHP